jgi:hypothetical protein
MLKNEYPTYHKKCCIWKEDGNLYGCPFLIRRTITCCKLYKEILTVENEIAQRCDKCLKINGTKFCWEKFSKC